MLLTELLLHLFKSGVHQSLLQTAYCLVEPIVALITASIGDIKLLVAK